MQNISHNLRGFAITVHGAQIKKYQKYTSLFDRPEARKKNLNLESLESLESQDGTFQSPPLRLIEVVNLQIITLKGQEGGGQGREEAQEGGHSGDQEQGRT